MENRSNTISSLLLVAAITALLLYLSQSLLVAPSGAIDSGFSEPHAYETLSRLLSELKPHVAGSPENAVVRDRIVAELTAAGYAPELQSAFQCEPAGHNPGCTTVENIIAVHKGSGTGKAVLATAHYDSVPAGPGVSDDGAGVAVVLELARFLVGQKTRNDVIFLIADGEETGLRGALAFAERHPLMKRVGVVVNVEARGASGASLMFETGPGNARLMDLFAHTVTRPATNSVSYEVYRLLPNDTDFSVYRKLGIGGFNFAFSNSASLYHSARDNLALIDRKSLQHQGEHAFEVVRALADSDLAALGSESDSSYFDVFGRFLVTWPAAINVPAALLAVIAIIGLIVVHRSAFTQRSTWWAVGAMVAVFALLFGVGWALSYPLGVWPGVHPLDHPAPWPARVALLTAALLAVLVVAAVARGRAQARQLLLVNWLVLAIIAAAVAFFVNGASYPFLWPALVFAFVAWGETLLGRESLPVASWVGFGSAAFFWLGLFLVLELVLGFHLSQYKILTLAPLVLALVPLFVASVAKSSRPAWILWAVCALIVAAAAGVASQTPAYAANHPRGVNIIYYDDRGASPRWLIGFVGTPDESYLKAQGLPSHDEEYLQIGLIKGQGRFKPAGDQHLAAPTMTVHKMATNADATVVHGTLKSGRGGFLVGLGFAAGSGVRSIRIDGQELLSAQQTEGEDPINVRLAGVGARELAVDISYDSAAKPTLVLYERSPLPDSEEGRALIAARPNDAAPVNGGDSALVVQAIDLASAGRGARG